MRATVLCDSRKLGELYKRLRELDHRIARKYMKKALQIVAKQVVKDARSLVPIRTEGLPPGYRGGALKRSLGVRIKVYQRGAVVVALVGPRRDRKGRPARFRLRLAAKPGAKNPNKTNFIYASNYAHLIEFGTSRSPAKPFLRPAAQRNRSFAVSTVTRMLREGLQVYRQGPG
jgi:HK97 gp10 family phage protein